MSSSPLSLVSENEYLHTPYKPDCDYIDGAVLERNLGQHDQARLQGLLLYWLMQHEKQWQIHTVPECRLKIRAQVSRARCDGPALWSLLPTSHRTTAATLYRSGFTR